MKQQTFIRFGGLTAILGVAVSMFGLFTFFAGAGSGDTPSIDKALKNGSDLSQAQTGAVWIIVGMSLLIAFSVWLACRYGRDSVLLSMGAAILSLGAITHFVENLLAVGLYGSSLPAIKNGSAPDVATAASLHITGTATNIAFGFLGAGVLLAALGFLIELNAPKWLTSWGVIAGAAGIVSAFIDFPVSQPLLLGWIIAVGIRATVTHAGSPRTA